MVGSDGVVVGVVVSGSGLGSEVNNEGAVVGVDASVALVGSDVACSSVVAVVLSATGSVVVSVGVVSSEVGRSDGSAGSEDAEDVLGAFAATCGAGSKLESDADEGAVRGVVAAVVVSEFSAAAMPSAAAAAAWEIAWESASRVWEAGASA